MKTLQKYLYPGFGIRLWHTHTHTINLKIHWALDRRVLELFISWHRSESTLEHHSTYRKDRLCMHASYICKLLLSILTPINWKNSWTLKQGKTAYLLITNIILHNYRKDRLCMHVILIEHFYTNKLKNILTLKQVKTAISVKIIRS